ncbi:MAG: ABC transporter ATP-binding protein [Clostridia bacterium]
MPSGRIEARALEKRFGALPVLTGLSFSAALSDICVVLGRSGCGKTTLLNIVGGLDAPDAGCVTGLEVAKSAFVFQEPRLMPWLSVEKNIAFGLDRAARDPEKIARLIALTGLAGFEKARPAALSGGMKQRVALARALAVQPQYLLMDEPFAALDSFTRAAMQKELLRIHAASRPGVLFVTHSVDEALVLADRILVLADGRVKREYALGSLPRPRDPLDPAVISIKKRILMDIEERDIEERTE